jgi:tetratricopeptide (TPR) repeat protein
MKPWTSLLVFVALLAAATPARADADAHYRQGMAYQNTNKIDEAIASFEKCVAEAPKHVMAWASLGKLYKGKKQYDKSVAAYEQATTLAPKEAALWGNLGYAYYHAGKPDQALEALDKSCKLDHNNAQVAAFIGTIKRQKGDIPGAIKALKWAVKLKPDDPDYQNNLGVAYRKGKQYPQAVAAFKKALALKEDAVFHFDLAVTYRAQEEIDDAIVHYEAAVRLDPKMAGAWKDLGIMYKANHQDDKAIDAWQHFLDIEKTGPEAEEVKKAIEGAGGTVKRKPK